MAIAGIIVDLRTIDNTNCFHTIRNAPSEAAPNIRVGNEMTADGNPHPNTGDIPVGAIDANEHQVNVESPRLRGLDQLAMLPAGKRHFDRKTQLPVQVFVNALQHCAASINRGSSRVERI